MGIGAAGIWNLAVYLMQFFPRWVGMITLIGGVAGALTLAVYQTPILAILQAITFIVLTSYVSLFLLRGKNIESGTALK